MGNYTLEEEAKSWKAAAKHNLYKSARNNSRASRKKQWIKKNIPCRDHLNGICKRRPEECRFAHVGKIKIPNSYRYLARDKFSCGYRYAGENLKTEKIKSLKKYFPFHGLQLDSRGDEVSVSHWIFDSHIPNHVTCDRSICFDVIEQRSTISISGHEFTSVAVGKCRVAYTLQGEHRFITLVGVHIVPSLGGNLLAVSRFLQKGCRTRQDSNCLTIYDKCGVVVIGQTYRVNGQIFVHLPNAKGISANAKEAPNKARCIRQISDFKKIKKPIIAGTSDSPTEFARSSIRSTSGTQLIKAVNDLLTTVTSLVTATKGDNVAVDVDAKLASITAALSMTTATATGTATTPSAVTANTDDVVAACDKSSAIATTATVTATTPSAVTANTEDVVAACDRSSAIATTATATSTATKPSAVTANLEDAIAARNRSTPCDKTCSTTTIANTVKVSAVGVYNICNTYDTITRCFLVKTILPTYVSLVTLVMLLLLTNLTKQAER